MPKRDITLLVPYNIFIDSTVRTSTVVIDGNIGISTNETLALNNFYIQYLFHTFFGALEFS